MTTLTMDRPLIVFDLETTGTNVKTDRIVEISVVKITQDGERTIKTRKLNPEMPIPLEASEIHGIYDKDVENEPTFKQVARTLANFMEGCDLGGFNVIGFDIPLIVNEFKRVDVEFDMEGRRIVDAFKIFQKMERRDLTSAYRFYCGKELGEAAHSAEADTLATVDVIFGQMDKYTNEELPHDVQGIHEFCTAKDPSWVDKSGKFRWSGNDVAINFGKNRGEPLKKVAVENPGFLKWIMREDFDDDTKAIASDALIGTFPKKPTA